MLQSTWNDCYADYDRGILTIGNSRTERRFVYENGFFKTVCITDKENSYRCGESETPTAKTFPEIKCESDVWNNNGLSEDALRFKAVFSENGAEHTWSFTVFPKLPFVTIRRWVKGAFKESVSLASAEATGIEAAPINKADSFDPLNVCDCIALPKTHLKAENVRFFDRTDENDTLVKSSNQIVYPNWEYLEDGNILLISDYLNGEALLVVKEAPTHLSAIGRNGSDFLIKNNTLYVLGTGADNSLPDEKTPLYSATVGIAKADEIHALWDKMYKTAFSNKSSPNTFIMSNTWGDRNRDGAVCFDFIKKEIDAAREIGVDIVQIDDGWQKGVSANSKRSKGGVWAGYYDFDPDFWQADPVKFPDGLKPVAEYAAKNNVSLGLWFAPDSSNDFKNYEKDVENILRLHSEYGVKHFKLDSVNLKSKRGERNFCRLLELVSEKSGGEITFNLDVTAQSRLGYIYRREFGTIFVENRYTDFHNYYPHNTLKNLWHLSRWIPSKKLQFELLNNGRNTDLYHGDPLAPHSYSMSYEFACVMLANPLLWMEMSNLPEEKRRELHNIVLVYREHRDNLSNSRIIPIGDEPDGVSFTGFQAVLSDNEGYLLLFNGISSESEAVLNLAEPLMNDTAFEKLFDEGDCSVNLADNGKSVLFNAPKKRSFCFIRYYR